MWEKKLGLFRRRSLGRSLGDNGRSRRAGTTRPGGAVETLEPRTLLTALVSGLTVKTTIALAGEQDQYTFAATSGNALLVDLSTVSGQFNFSASADLFRPDGTLIKSFQGIFSIDAAPVTGTYRLIVHDDDATQLGSYNVTAAIVPGVQNADGDAGPLISGKTRSATTDRGDLDVHTITVNAGDTLLADISTTAGQFGYAATMSVYDPNGAPLIKDTTFAKFTNVTKGGTYYVVVYDDNGLESGTYNLTAARTSGIQDADGDAGPIISGKTRAAAVIDRGDLDVNTITANAGDTLLVDASTVSGQFGFLVQFDVYGPDGTPLVQNSSFSRLTALAKTGTYYIIAHDDNGFESGTYGLTVAKIPGAQDANGDAGAATSGLSRSSTISRGNLDVNTLTLNAGDTLEVAIGTISGAFGFAARFDVYGPNGAMLATDQVLLRMPHVTTAGTYYIVAHDDNGIENGAYGLTIARLPGAQSADVDAGFIADGANRRSTTTLGDLDVYPFQGVAGDKIIATVGSNGGTFGYTPVFDFVDPTGTYVKTDIATTGTLALTQTGTYFFVVHDDDAFQGGTYHFGFTYISGTTKPQVSVVATDPDATEAGKTTGTFTITRTAVRPIPITVSYTVSGTAASGADYVALSGTVTIPANSVSANVIVTPIDDTLPEPAETVILTLKAVSGDNGGTLNPTQKSATVTIADNDGKVTTGGISGLVFKDLNSNGLQNLGEPGQPGVVLFLDANHNGIKDSTEKSTTSDATGQYAFTLLAPGSYRVREIVPAGFVLKSPASGFYDVSVTAGTTQSGKIFANAPVPTVGSIAGRVFNDANGDGKFEIGELGLGLWKVFIDADKDGIFQATEKFATTDITGAWSFTNLAAGTYVVRLVPVSGTAITAPLAKSYTMALSAGQNVTGEIFGIKGTA